MCYEFERFYELQRAEQERREKAKAEEEKRNKSAKPATQEPGPGKREPVPA